MSASSNNQYLIPLSKIHRVPGQIFNCSGFVRVQRFRYKINHLIVYHFQSPKLIISLLSFKISIFQSLLTATCTSPGRHRLSLHRVKLGTTSPGAPRKREPLPAAPSPPQALRRAWPSIAIKWSALQHTAVPCRHHIITM